MSALSCSWVHPTNQMLSKSFIIKDALFYVSWILDNICWKVSSGAWQRVKLLPLFGGALRRVSCPWSSSWLCSQKPCLALPLVRWTPQLLTCGSFPGTGTNPVRSWRWILGLRSSWLPKWWTTTSFPSPQTCGAWVSSHTCCEWPCQGSCGGSEGPAGQECSSHWAHLAVTPPN